MRLAFEINTMHMNIHIDTHAHADVCIQNMDGMHDTGSEGEPPLTANSHGSPQTSVGVMTASAKAAPVQLAQGQNWSKLCPLFHPGEQVLVKAGPVPKGTSPYWGPYTVEKVLG